MSLRNTLLTILAMVALAALSGHWWAVLFCIGCGCFCIVFDWLYPEPQV